MTNGTRPRRRTSVRQRLALVVLVPTIGLAAFGAVAGIAQSREVQRAATVQRWIRHADQVLRVKLAIADEAFATGGVLGAHAFGVDVADLGRIGDFDPLAMLGDSRRLVDAAVRRADRVPEVAEIHGRLGIFRAAMDAGKADIQNVLPEYAQVQEELTHLATDALLRAEDAAGDVARSTSLRRSTAMLRASVEAAAAVNGQLDAIARMVIGDVASSAVALADLRLAQAAERDAVRRVDRLVPGPLAAGWRAVRTMPETRRLTSEVQVISSSNPGQLTFALGDLVSLFQEGRRALDAFEATATAASTHTKAAAERQRDEAERELLLTVGLSIATGAAAVGLTALIARSIGEPLKALADRAVEVASGDISDDRPPIRGPEELVAVGRTFEELVDNLRVVEAQLGALAAGNLGDPILDVPVPGRIGNLLHDSVLRLSRSITERELLAQRLEHEATHDALTGLPNRGSLVTALRRALEGPAASGDVALVIIDLDGFKPVNETHGHEAGDRLLRVTADRLRSHLGPDDVVARIGGDEFALLVHGVCDPEELAGRLIRHVASPVRVGAVVTQVRASAGVAVADGDLDPEGLLRQAGLAATAAKTSGGGAVERFDAAMLGEVVRRADIEARLRAALTGGDLVLQFQPVVDADLRADGAEALLRWRQPDGTLLAPGRFIPVAEASDLIVDIGRWVLGEACQLLASWTDDPVLGSIRLSVNLSARHVLSLTVVDDVRASLEEAGVDASRLSLEVTETMVLSDLPIATDHLRRLQELGVTIAVDDFGTGYTSLGHLRELPVDVIKIDRSLVVAAASREADARVVELVVGAAHAMGLSVVAEGIETAHQLEVLRAAGCDRFQGYLIARPGPVEVLLAPAAAQTS